PKLFPLNCCRLATKQLPGWRQVHFDLQWIKTIDPKDFEWAEALFRVQQSDNPPQERLQMVIFELNSRGLSCETHPVTNHRVEAGQITDIHRFEEKYE